MRLARGSLTAVAGLVLAVAPALAQQAGPGRVGMGRMAGPNLEELTTRLTLTEGQQARIKVLIGKFETDTRGVRETLTKNMQAIQSGASDAASLREESMAAMMLLREDAAKLNQDIRVELSPEQRAEFDRYLEEQRARMRPGGRPGGPPPLS